MYRYFNAGTHTCRSTRAHVASVRFQRACKKLGYIKPRIATVRVCTANAFLILVTARPFSNSHEVATTIPFILTVQPNYLSRAFPGLRPPQSPPEAAAHAPFSLRSAPGPWVVNKNKF